jgi:hypothetical protein
MPVLYRDEGLSVEPATVRGKVMRVVKLVCMCMCVCGCSGQRREGGGVSHPSLELEAPGCLLEVHPVGESADIDKQGRQIKIKRLGRRVLDARQLRARNVLRVLATVCSIPSKKSVCQRPDVWLDER